MLLIKIIKNAILNLLFLVETIILWSSGVNIDIVRKCEDNSKTKFISIGLVIIFTGVMATITAAMTLTHAFPNPEQSNLVLFGGILWGVGIFIIDRLAVSSMQIDDNIKVKLLSAVPRIILATAIAYVIVIPLKLELFKEEVEKEIAEIVKEEKIVIEQGSHKDKRREIKNDLNSIQKEIEDKNSEIQNLINSDKESRFKVRISIITKELDVIIKDINDKEKTLSTKVKERKESWSLRYKEETKIQKAQAEIDVLTFEKNELGCENRKFNTKCKKNEDDISKKRKEINNAKQNFTSYTSRFSKLKKETGKLDSEIQKLRDIKNAKEDSINSFSIRGEEITNKDIDNLNEIIKNLRAQQDSLNERINELDKSDRNYKTNFENIISSKDGLGIQIKALDRIKNPMAYSTDRINKPIAYSSDTITNLEITEVNQVFINRNKDKKALQFYLMALTWVFLLIECMPILSKLFLRPSLYESRLNSIVEKVEKAQKKEIESIEINTKQELKYTEHLSKSARDELTKAQENIMKSIISKWEEDELKNIEDNPKKYIK